LSSSLIPAGGALGGFWPKSLTPKSAAAECEVLVVFQVEIAGADQRNGQPITFVIAAVRASATELSRTLIPGASWMASSFRQRLAHETLLLLEQGSPSQLLSGVDRPTCNDASRVYHAHAVSLRGRNELEAFRTRAAPQLAPGSHLGSDRVGAVRPCCGQTRWEAAKKLANKSALPAGCDAAVFALCGSFWIRPSESMCRSGVNLASSNSVSVAPSCGAVRGLGRCHTRGLIVTVRHPGVGAAKHCFIHYLLGYWGLAESGLGWKKQILPHTPLHERQ